MKFNYALNSIMGKGRPEPAPTVEYVGGAGILASLNGVYEFVLAFEDGQVQAFEGRPAYHRKLVHDHSGKQGYALWFSVPRDMWVMTEMEAFEHHDADVCYARCKDPAWYPWDTKESWEVLDVNSGAFVENKKLGVVLSPPPLIHVNGNQEECCGTYRIIGQTNKRPIYQMVKFDQYGQMIRQYDPEDLMKIQGTNVVKRIFSSTPHVN